MFGVWELYCIQCSLENSHLKRFQTLSMDNSKFQAISVQVRVDTIVIFVVDRLLIFPLVDCADAISKMLTVDSKDRITVSSLLVHPFITKQTIESIPTSEIKQIQCVVLPSDP